MYEKIYCFRLGTQFVSLMYCKDKLFTLPCLIIMGSNNKGGRVKFGQILKVGSLAGQTLIKVMANKGKRVIKCVQK